VDISIMDIGVRHREKSNMEEIYEKVAEASRSVGASASASMICGAIGYIVENIERLMKLSKELGCDANKLIVDALRCGVADLETFCDTKEEYERSEKDCLWEDACE
jgi:hypothetical protein